MIKDVKDYNGILIIVLVVLSALLLSSCHSSIGQTSSIFAKLKITQYNLTYEIVNTENKGDFLYFDLKLTNSGSQRLYFYVRNLTNANQSLKIQHLSIASTTGCFPAIIDAGKAHLEHYKVEQPALVLSDLETDIEFDANTSICPN